MKVDTLRTLQFEADGIGPSNESGYNYLERDANLVEGACCHVCGGEMMYAAVLNNGAYRAFAVCEVCDSAYEF